MSYRASVGSQGDRFADLREVTAKASPARSGDALAGIAARSAGASGLTFGHSGDARN